MAERDRELTQGVGPYPTPNLYNKHLNPLYSALANVRRQLKGEEALSKHEAISNPTGKSSEGRDAGSKINISSYLSGMNVRLAGRLMTQSLRPRFTEQTHQEGSLARVKVHFIEKSRFTGKNKRGAYSFTITISHVIN